MKKLLLGALLFIGLNSFSQNQKTTYTIVGKELCQSDDDVNWICKKVTTNYTKIEVEFGNTGEWELGIVSYTNSKEVYDESIYSTMSSTEFTTNPYGNKEATITIDNENKMITVSEPYLKQIYKFK